MLVGHLEAAQLLRYGDAVGGGEGETRHGAEQYALGLGDVAAVEHIDTPGVAVLGPEVLCVGHTVDEVRQALTLALRGVVDEDEVEQQTVHLVVLEGAQHLLGVAAVLHAAYLHEEDGDVAADAETPQAALREGVLRQQGVAVVAERGGLRHILGHAVVEAHLAALEEREAVAHVVEHRRRLEGVLYVGGAVILLRKLQQLLAGFGEAGEDIGLGALARRYVHAAAHAHHRVEGGAHGARQRAAALYDVGVAQAVAAPQELEARGLVLNEAVALINPQAVQHVVTAAVGSGAVEEQRLVLGVVLRQHLHAGKDAVVLILFGRCQQHFAVGGQLKVYILAAVVGEGDASQLGATVFEHRDLRLGLYAVVYAQVADLVAGEAHVVAFRLHVEGREGVAPQVVVTQVAYIEVGAVVVGGDLAVAVEHRVLVAREAAAAVVHQDGVLPVADDANLRHVGDAVEVTCVALGLHLAVLVALVLRHLEVYVRLHLGLFLEQGVHASHGGFLHEVALQALVAEVIGQRRKYHALVVGVVGLDGHVVFVVIAFVEAIFVIHPEPLETLHVVVHGAVVDADGHQRAVGRQHDAVGRGVLELEVRHAESVVFVVLRVVELVVRRLADAPRHVLLAGIAHEGTLGADGEAVGLVHERVLEGGQEDERHEVLEHGAVPRRHAFVAFVLHQRLVEAEPVLVGRVALRNGEERRQARLAGEVVVVVWQQRVVGGVVAYAEDVELGVVQLAEVCLVYEPLHLGFEAVDGALVAHGGEPALHGIEAGHEIAAVAGADEEVRQCLQRAHAVPVVQVPVPLVEPRHGVYDVFHTRHSLLAADEAKLGGTDHGGERIADVGGRGLVVGLLLAVELVVVGYQPVVLFGDEAVEEVPRVLCQPAHLLGLFLGEVLLVLRELEAETVHHEWRTAPHHNAEQRRHQGCRAKAR